MWLPSDGRFGCLDSRAHHDLAQRADVETVRILPIHSSLIRTMSGQSR